MSAIALQSCRPGLGRRLAPFRSPQAASYDRPQAPRPTAASATDRSPARRLRTSAAAVADTSAARLGLSKAAGCSLASRTVRRRPLRGGTCVVAAVAAAAASAAAASPPAASPLMASLAVVIGWMVIAGSCIRSLPQILRILKNQSVRGLSLTSFSSELLCYIISVAYNLAKGFPFSTFGDTAICALQNVAIIGLIFRLGTVPRRTQLALGAGLAGAGWWLLSGRCPPALLTALQTFSVVLLALGGRLPQILLNVQRGNSGELSLLSCALSLAGNTARVFTTLTLVGDPIILGSAATQAVLNGILTWQTIETARRLRSSPPASPQAA